VDYAPALTGFKFSGRKGTAVFTGVVVPAEAEEAVWAVIAGLEDLAAEAEREARSRAALRWWRVFLVGLRIRERIWAGVDEEAEKGGSRSRLSRVEDGGGEVDEDEDEAGGFTRDEDGDEDEAGGFTRDEDEDEAGGFTREEKGKGVAADEDDMDLDAAPSDVTEELDFVEDEDGGGGFLLDDDDAGGGFMAE
jgi:xeroderma pigmentosum group C-complementing protein